MAPSATPRPVVRRLLPARGVTRCSSAGPVRSRTASRLRGDGPASVRTPARSRSCFPFARGWSPRRPHASLSPGPAPRARGDGPYRMPEDGTSRACSPPALASPPVPAASRACGDGPGMGYKGIVQFDCSPHMRGWTRCRIETGPGHFLLPTPAGMTPAHLVPVPGFRLLPAHAGMDPGSAPARTRASTCPCPSAPRTRGDGPFGGDMTRQVLVHPRACGGGPGRANGRSWNESCSPHPWDGPNRPHCRRLRGWSQG